MRYLFLLSVYFCTCILSTYGQEESRFRFEGISDQSIRLSDGTESVWVYNFGPITRNDLPETEKRRTRACYIHPLYGLRGEVLTDDFPRDHYHHHGIFWTWPHIGIQQPDGQVKQYDTWQDSVGDLRQQFVQWKERTTNGTSATLAVENGWFAGGEKVMVENVTIRTHAVKEEFHQKTRAIDLEFLWIPTDKPITLRGAEEKSYGGLTIRFRPQSNKPGEEKITTITVPGGVAEGDLPETPLPWADFTSRFGTGEHRSGAAIFIPPSHPDFPPTWLTRYYGPLCVGWPGVRERTFQPNEEIRLTYRLWVHESEVDTEQIRKAYEEQMKNEK